MGARDPEVEHSTGANSDSSVDRKFSAYNNLYQIRDPFDRRAFRASLVEQGDPWHDAWIRGDRLPRRTVTVSHAMGSKTPQLCIWTTSQALVFHNSAIEELRNARLTGWTTYGVRLADDLEHLAKDYVGFAVIGRCGEIDYSAGQWIHRKTPTGKDAPVLRGIRFDPTSWDQSDFFAPSTPGLLKIFCTAAARTVLGRFGNVEFTALPDVEIEKASLPSGARLPAS